MENQMALEQSSLTFEEGFKKTKENPNELLQVQEKEHSKRRNEYEFMDGVLGCVKV